MKFFDQLPKEDGLYWALFKEFDSCLFKSRNPSPYFSYFSDTVQLVIRETIKNKSYFYCQKTLEPIDPSAFYFGDKINKPESIEIFIEMEF